MIGKDHSVLCSGLHADVFDEIWICRPWNEIDLASHRRQIRRRLASGSHLISGLDVEVRWLAESPMPGAIIPSLESLRLAAKPAFSAAVGLPVRVPPFLSLDAGSRSIFDFCRRHDWRVWVKGPAYEARPAEAWPELLQAEQALEATWGGGDLFVQAHVEGAEVSVAFAAWNGKLLDAVFMEKRLLTEQGKTWAGAIGDVAPEVYRSLATAIAALQWSGGGELELVRDRADDLWLIDWNPRFPAWIFGATIAGRNLPALLVAAAARASAPAAFPVAAEFTRVVIEIPTRSSAPLPVLALGSQPPAAAGKHPSGMPLIQRRLAARRPPRQVRAAGARLGELLQRDLRRVCSRGAVTPYHALLELSAEDRFGRLAQGAAVLGRAGVPVRVAYSVKTNPDLRFLRLARGYGFLAEVISPGERNWALAAGFTADQLVYNGPLPVLCSAPAQYHAVFADSTEALRRYAACPPGVVTGARLRAPGIVSRFGIEVERIEELEVTVDLVGRLAKDIAFGVSVHLPSSALGLGRWASAVRATVRFGATLAALAGRPVRVLDLGGGWDPADVDELLTSQLPVLLAEARAALPRLEEVLLEPGKSLVEPCGTVVSTVVELRGRDGWREAVVDASIAEVPLVQFSPHRTVVVAARRLALLGAGPDRILGRLCLENDVLATGVALPSWLAEGDHICFCDTGAYDASMSFEFGKGGGGDDNGG